MHWLRFSHEGRVGFGRLDGEQVVVCSGDMFGTASPTGALLRLDETTFELPCLPSQFIALSNNFHELAKKKSLPIPAAPLYFLKGANSFCAHRRPIAVPRSEVGRVVYEGELGVVIGKQGRDIALEGAPAHIFGYTCVNDVTALTLLTADASFPQWTRAKSFDSFTPFGPFIATELSLDTAWVRTLVNGKERQKYPLADMIFSPTQLVSLISRDVTLLPGDVISCGTSVGVGPLVRGAQVEVAIDGIGTLSNRYGEERAT